MKTRHRIGLTAGKISYKALRKINPEAARFLNITDVYFKNLSDEEFAFNCIGLTLRIHL